MKIMRWFSKGLQKHQEKIKRLCDIVGSCAGLVLFVGPVTMAAAAIVIKQRTNPFFVQDRIGMHGKTFKIIKLKTIYDGEINDLGRFLRHSKIDEFPQMWNVLRGQMSLVGPRPLMTTAVIAQDPMRQQVKPGITGYAQINGGNDLTDEKKLKKDKAYIRRKGALWLDAHVLTFTLSSIFNSIKSGSHINAQEVHMQKITVTPETHDENDGKSRPLSQRPKEEVESDPDENLIRLTP